MNLEQVVPEALRRLRAERRMTQKQVGELAGSSQGRVGDYERGRSLPSLPVLFRLLGAMGYNLRDLQDVIDEIEGIAGEPAAREGVEPESVDWLAAMIREEARGAREVLRRRVREILSEELGGEDKGAKSGA